MLISLFCLCVAVGESFGKVMMALFDSRVLGALTISVLSAFIVGSLAVAVGIPAAYLLILFRLCLP